MNLLDITPYLDAIERIQEEIVLERCTPLEQYYSKLLYTVLSACFMTGRARSVFKLVPNASCFEAYQRVLLDYEPREPARYAAMLIAITQSRWSGKLSELAGEMREWELAVQRYEESTHYPMPDDVKCSVVSMHCPRAIQSYLRVSDMDLLINYKTLRTGIFRFLTRGHAVGREGQLQGVPMELDAVTGPVRPWNRLVPGKGKGKAGGWGAKPTTSTTTLASTGGRGSEG
eukprot:11433374-Heterocapsa_arctica.AAC.1